MPLDLDDSEQAAPIELLTDTIERERFPLSLGAKMFRSHAAERGRVMRDG
jgi:hypothetical protein